jgi:hypothetical protein
VLSTAANVVSPIDRKMAKQLWQEGVRVESDLIRVGQTPAVSLMATGQADCASATNFVENLPENVAVQAEQSLIGAVTSCPKQTLDLVARKLDAALDKDIVAPRALMAVMEVQGHNAPASQQRFDKMFRSLPDAGKNSDEAENFAAMYAQMAPDVDKELAAKAGLELLAWLGKVKDSPVRTLAINITTGAMQQALGEEAFRKALEKDVVAQSTVQNAGEPREIERPQEDTVSVLEAMDNVGTDRTDACGDSLRCSVPVRLPRMALLPAHLARRTRQRSISIWRFRLWTTSGMLVHPRLTPLRWCRRLAKPRLRLIP